jgi:uncharacterized protein involved in exopolysaccharide biosynthesis
MPQPLNTSYQPAARDDFDATVEEGAGFKDQIEALGRRKWPMLAAFLTVLAAVTAAALLWPATYRSAGTVLIEQQEVPLDFVRSAVSSYADERVQVISQRVMTSSNLLGIIDKYGLYAEDRDDLTREELIEKARENIKIEMISADVMDPRGGGARKATIAFSLGFESPSPQQATRVANDLVTLFLRENLETRKQQAASTTAFLTAESARLGASVAALERRISEFKEQNYEQLPEFIGTTTTLLASTEQQLRDIETRLSSLDQQMVYIDSQLALVDPRMPAVTGDGQTILGASDRLRALREQYVSQLANYTPRHPQVAEVKREIYSLELQSGGGSEALGILSQIEASTEELVAARHAATPDSAEIQRLETQLATLTRRLKDMPVRGPASQAEPSTADNPAYLNLQAQKQTMLTERNVLGQRRSALQGQLFELQQRQARTPAVERDYGALLRDLQGEQGKYQEVRQKLMEAQLAQNLESEQKGERFTLIEPPITQQEPVKPNRPAIFSLGVLAAIGAAIGLMVILELLDTRIRGRRQVVKELGEPPLAIIPWLGDQPVPYEPVLRKRLWQRLRGRRRQRKQPRRPPAPSAA